MSQRPKQPAKGKPIGKAPRAAPRDQRFEQAQYDPKFKAPSATLTKTKVDKRFAKMMKDPSFGVSSGVDRYGRKGEKSRQEHLKEYYYMDAEEEREEGVGEEEERSGPQGIWREEPEEEKKEEWRKSWKELLEERANHNEAFDERRLR